MAAKPPDTRLAFEVWDWLVTQPYGISTQAKAVQHFGVSRSVMDWQFQLLRKLGSIKRLADRGTYKAMPSPPPGERPEPAEVDDDEIPVHYPDMPKAPPVLTWATVLGLT